MLLNIQFTEPPLKELSHLNCQYCPPQDDDSGQYLFPGDSVVNNPPANAEDTGSIPGSGISPGGGHGNPPSILSWRILWKEEPGGLPPMGLQIRNKSKNKQMGPNET